MPTGPDSLYSRIFGPMPQNIQAEALQRSGLATMQAAQTQGHAGAIAQGVQAGRNYEDQAMLQQALGENPNDPNLLRQMFLHYLTSGDAESAQVVGQLLGDELRAGAGGTTGKWVELADGTHQWTIGGEAIGDPIGPQDGGNLTTKFLPTQDGLYFVDEANGRVEKAVEYGPDGADPLATYRYFNDDLKRTGVRELREISGRIQALYERRDLENAADDIVAIFALIQGIEPTGIVREGEQQMVIKAQSILSAMGERVNHLISGGGRIGPELIEDIHDTFMNVLVAPVMEVYDNNRSQAITAMTDPMLGLTQDFAEKIHQAFDPEFRAYVQQFTGGEDLDTGLNRILGGG